MHIYNDIVDDKLEFVNEITELFDNAIEKKEFGTLKDNVLKLIGNSCIYDVKKKGRKKDNKEEDGKKDDKEKDSKKDNKMVPAHKDKLNLINETIKKLQKLKIDIRNKIQPINNSINKLLRDLQLRLVELAKMDIEINDLINVAWQEIYEKKRRD